MSTSTLEADFDRTERGGKAAVPAFTKIFIEAQSLKKKATKPD
jgi:hypothetical protein